MPSPCVTRWQTVPVTDAVDPALAAEAVVALRRAGARFAFVHGSRARGTHRPDSDLYVAAWWAGTAPPSFEVPDHVDLMVLNGAPLELAGRVAQEGVLLFDDDPPARVHWVATTRKIYADEKPRFDRAHQDFVDGVLRGR